jgi:hypothetical protein
MHQVPLCEYTGVPANMTAEKVRSTSRPTFSPYVRSECEVLVRCSSSLTL